MRAAKTATSGIPIVFTFEGDPVEFGLVASLNHPGGNVTGITLISSLIVPRRIGLLRDLIPGIKTIAILMNSTSPANKTEVAAAEQAARTLGWEVRVLSASGKEDFDAAFQPLTQERAEALLVCTDPIFESQRDQIIALAAHHGAPAIYALREYPMSGGLMSYGASITDLYRQAGVYVGRILKGERPADLPVMQASKFELVVNLKTAKALGLTVPPSLLIAADEVIE